MKHNLLFTLVFLLASLTISAQQVTIDKIPESIEEFAEMRNQLAKTPEGAAAMYILALKIYTNNEELGEKCLIIMTDKKLLRENAKGYKGYTLLNTDMNLIKTQLGKNRAIPDSYISGSSPENGYRTSLPYKFEFTTNNYSGDKNNGPYKLFVKCSGADSPRPITLKKNNKGLWKANNWSSILVGIKAVPEDDDL